MCGGSSAFCQITFFDHLFYGENEVFLNKFLPLVSGRHYLENDFFSATYVHCFSLVISGISFS